MSDRLATLYPQHLAYVKARADHALARGGHDLLLVAAGTQTCRFLDDTPNPFYANPQFKWWLPLTQHPDCWIAYVPGRKPVLVYVQPADYWHVPPRDPAGYWVEHFDIRVVGDAAQVRAQLPRELARAAIIGEPSAALEGVAPNNPQAVLDSLHLSRTRKTGYEIECLRRASLKGAIAHRAAGTAFPRAPQRVRDPPRLLRGLRPSRARVALRPHRGAQRARPPCTTSSSTARGRQSTIHCSSTPARSSTAMPPISRAPSATAIRLHPERSRSTSYNSRCARRCGRARLEGLSPGFVSRGGASPAEAGDRAHGSREPARYLRDQRVPPARHRPLPRPAGARRRRLLQDERASTIPRPYDHPYLRCTRKLDADYVVTVEPGFYFIDSCWLDCASRPIAARWIGRGRSAPTLRRRTHRGQCVRDPGGQAENLTRDAFRALAG